MKITLLNILKLIADDYFPVIVDEDGSIDTRPQSVFKVTICFMCEEETWITCNIQNEILVPWYDCEVSNIYPDKDNILCVWLKDEKYIKENFSQHLIRGNTK